jgi:hypothetical protein
LAARSWWAPSPTKTASSASIWRFGTLLAAIYAGQVALAFVLRRREGSGVSTRKALALFTAIGLAEGVVWSIGIVGVSATRPIEQELTVLLLGAGIAAGAALSFGFHMPTFLRRFLGAAVPYVLFAVFRGGHPAISSLGYRWRPFAGAR